MSTVVWSMKWTSLATGAVQSAPLAAFGIDSPMVRFRSLDDDEFTFDARQNVYSPTQFAYGDQIVLYKSVGGVQTVWFIGTVTKRTVVGNPRTETVKYVVSGPWWQLKRTLMQASANFYAATGCALIPANTSKLVLFQDPVTGAAITTGRQIQNAILYALGIGVPIVFGTTPAFVNVPLEETRDLTVADVIRRAMQWTPDGVSWVDYSTGVAIFNAQQRAFLSSVTMDLSQENLVTGLHLVKRDDLVPSGVRFNYVGIAQCNVNVPTGCVDPSTGVLNTGPAKLSNAPVQVSTDTIDQSGLPDMPGGLVATIDLTQLTATTTEAPPLGLAGLYYLSLLTATWDGTVTTKASDCAGVLRPGKVVNFTNGAAEWGTMNAQIHEVTENLYTGETSAQFGTPGHLQPQNFHTLFQMTARRPLVTSGFASTNTPGSANGTACQQGINPATQKLLTTIGGSPAAVVSAPGNGAYKQILNTAAIVVCNNGVATTVEVYAP